tara:strand:+ start:544 stop:1671 length:1128 start_codon:yes stop_codon:yes gene_type:complete
MQLKPNVIFILLDGARWDRLNESKEFQDVCKKGTILNNVSTAMPYTIGSINVTFSGLFGKENGIDSYHNMLRLKKSIKNLPEIFQSQGYFTACDVLTKNIIPDRGFNIHQTHNEFKDDLTKRHPNFVKQCLKESNGKPLFLFLYFSKLHTVTVSDVLKKYEWDEKEFYDNKDENLSRYDNVFKEVGKYTKLITDELEKLNLKENTILVFFSDHGTGVGERFGERNYGSFTYEETIRTFFLFISSGIQKNCVSNTLRATVDIFPTILDLAKIELEFDRPGKSFSKYLLKDENELKESLYTFSETGAVHGPWPSPEECNVFCIKSPTHKLMYLKTPNEWLFFDLQNDPYETNNIFTGNSEIEKKMKEKLIGWINRED